jgi:tetratricopeptide (TPR) repeat protein
MSRAHRAIKSGRFDDALARLSAAEKYADPSPELQAEITYLRGRAYEGMKRIGDAIGCYRYIVVKFPQSVYAYQSRERLKELDKPQ